MTGGRAACGGFRASAAWWRAGSVAVLVAVCASCTRDLPPCDPALARQLVYLDAPGDLTGDDGIPMYAGQALAYASCGAGTYCHADQTYARLRVGAPIGLDFDVAPACIEYTCNSADEDLRASEIGRDRLLAHATRAYASAVDGTMPPGRVGREVVERVGRFVVGPDLAAAALLPSLSSPEGRALFGAWLACGAPLVTSTVAPDASVPRAPGDACAGDAVGDCFVRAESNAASFAVCPSTDAPTYDELYDRIFEPLCAEGCHGSSSPTSGSFRIRGRDDFYALLLEPIEPLPFVVPGEVTFSHLVHHLQGIGGYDVMPPGRLSGRLAPVALDAVEAWIEQGAQRSCAP